MNTTTQPQRRTLHPIVLAAAVAIIAFSGAGIAALLYNRSEAKSAPDSTPLAMSAAPAGATVAPPPAGFDNTAPLPATPAASQPAVAQDSPPQSVVPPQPQVSPPCQDCATVVATRAVAVRGESTGLGAVGGGLAGGLLGHAVGNGRGNVAMTLLGAAGGAVAGNAIEKNARTRTEYQLIVRYPDGHERSFMHAAPWSYQPGDTVRVDNGRIVALR